MTDYIKMTGGERLTIQQATDLLAVYELGHADADASLGNGDDLFSQREVTSAQAAAMKLYRVLAYAKKERGPNLPPPTRKQQHDAETKAKAATG